MYYAKIKHYDPANGPGIRISFFVSGCQFHCKECFNSETWDYDYGEIYTKETEKEILKEMSKSTYSGLSFLGGDPLWQYVPDITQCLIPLAKQVRALGKDVWIWSGFTWEQIMKDHPENDPWNRARKKLISNCDVWVDGLFVNDLKDLRLQYRGSSNQRVINIQESIKQNKIILVDVLR